MHLVALVDHPDHVCCRYRVTAFRPHLEAAGHTLQTLALPRSWWSRWQLYRSLAGATVLLQRRLLPFWELLLLRGSVSRLLFDLDDAVFLRDSYGRKEQAHPGRWRRFVSVVQRCDAVIAGNDWLAGQVHRAAPRVPVAVIPTCVDPLAYRPFEKPARETMHLVWVGSSSTLQGLERIRPLLDALGRQVPGLALKIVCDRFPEFAHLPVIRVPWSAETEAREIAEADVGISWIPDDDWSRGKCGLKILQYMAAGLPVVANPVGVHPAIVGNAETGYLATTEGEWVAALRTLVGEPDLRRRMGLAGRLRVERHFSVQAGGRAWLDLLTALEPSSRRRAA